VFSQNKKIIRDIVPNPFSDQYIPKQLPVRQDMVDFLAEKYYRSITRGYGGTDITLIYGSLGRVGIGKTTIAKASAYKLEGIARNRGINFRWIYINAYYVPTIHEIINRILSPLSRGAPARGTSLTDKLRMLSDIIYTNALKLLIIIDEVQSILLAGKKDEIEKFYVLMRLHETLPIEPGDSWIGYILVAQDNTVLSLFREILPQVESQIGHRILLDPYRTDELYKILLERASSGLEPGTWDDSVLEKIACYYGIDCPEAGDPVGSARKAIIALRNAAEYAEIHGLGYINDLAVSHALAEDAGYSVDRAALSSLSKHELLLLYAIAQLTLEKGDYSTTGEVRRLYEELAERYGEKPRGHTQVNEYTRRLAAKGLIIARPSGRGVRGRTTLLRVAQEIPADRLRSELYLILEGKVELG